jgi:hypothetical protein
VTKTGSTSLVRQSKRQEYNVSGVTFGISAETQFRPGRWLLGASMVLCHGELSLSDNHYIRATRSRGTGGKVAVAMGKLAKARGLLSKTAL